MIENIFDDYSIRTSMPFRARIFKIREAKPYLPNRQALDRIEPSPTGYEPVVLTIIL
jgi:hypothetical protein